MMVIYHPVKFEFDWTNCFRVRVQKQKCGRTSNTSSKKAGWLHATHLTSVTGVKTFFLVFGWVGLYSTIIFFNPVFTLDV